MNYREKIEGSIGVNYKAPKEINYLIDFLKDKNPEQLEILELGAADGWMAEQIITKLKPKRYVATEKDTKLFKEIKIKGIEAEVVDAEELYLFDDNSFDVVVSFNCLHHVNNPQKMADEILRVTRKWFFLCEPNKLCLPRNFLEMKKDRREDNDKSYFPVTYRKFFKEAEWIEIKPFNFAFTFMPLWFDRIQIFFSERFEKILIIRWQGSSLLIKGGIQY